MKRFSVSRKFVVLVILLFIVAVPFLANGTRAQGSGINVLVAKYDQARTGTDLNETVLNTTNVNVNQFGKLFTRAVVGDIYAQPLIVSGLAIPNQGVHNVVFVETMHNNVYAFDADDPNASTPLWQVNLGPSYTQNIPNWDIWEGEDGILGTPAIDLTTNTMYLVTHVAAQGATPAQHVLHALNITTGEEEFGGPTVIAATVPGSGPYGGNTHVTFDTNFHLQRVAATLLNGSVYIAFGSRADSQPWWGWIMAYNASNIQQQTAVLNVDANSFGGGMWNPQAISTDGTYLYTVTGNGDFNANTGGPDYGDSVLKLSPSLQILDYFTPYNQAYLNANDLDLGVTGVTVIPNSNLLITGGKTGNLYLMDRTNMGHFNATDDSQIVQSFQATFGHMHNTPNYYNGPDGPMVYIWAEQDYVKAFQLTNGQLNTIPFSSSQSPVVTAGMPAGILTVSANGSTPGTGIVWGTEVTAPTLKSGVMYAMDAHDLTRLLWSSQMNATRDAVGKIAKFNPPTVANGKVYLASFANVLNVYGLLGSVPPTYTPTATSTGTPTSTPGGPSATPTNTPTTTPTVTGGGTFYRAVNINGPATTIDGYSWDAGTAPNFTTTGWTNCSNAVPLIPPTDPNRTAMIHCYLFQRTAAATMSAVPSGAYNVYLYTWEDNNSETFSISVNGQLVQANYVSGPAGTWNRLGPWPVTVTAGTISITTTGGYANLSGMEVWNAGPPTPTNTPTFTPTSTTTITPGGPPTDTPTFTPTSTPTSTPTNTLTATATSTPTATLVLGSGTFYRAINLGGNALVLDGNNWEADAAPNFTTTGTSALTTSWLILNPSTDPTRTTMLQSFRVGYQTSFVMSNVPNGTYNVYVHEVETYAPRTYTIRLQGQVVLANFSSGVAGTWHKLGPWTATVTNGTLTLATNGQNAELSGLEVWSASGGQGAGVQPAPTFVP